MISRIMLVSNRSHFSPLSLECHHFPLEIFQRIECLLLVLEFNPNLFVSYSSIFYSRSDCEDGCPISAFIVNQYCSSSRSPSLVSTLFTHASWTESLLFMISSSNASILWRFNAAPCPYGSVVAQFALPHSSHLEIE